MRENNRKSIASKRKLPQFITMNVIDGQASLVFYSSLIFYSLTIDNILNIIILLILAGITINSLAGSGLFEKAQLAKEKTDASQKDENEKIKEYEDKLNGYINGTRDTVTITTEQYNDIINRLTALENKEDKESNVMTGTYVGTGTYGSSNMNTITFEKAPQIVFLVECDGITDNNTKYCNFTYFIQGSSLNTGNIYSSMSNVGATACYSEATWSNDGKTLSWYGIIDDNHQFNEIGTLYKWVAICE